MTDRYAAIGEPERFGFAAGRRPRHRHVPQRLTWPGTHA
ncbi:MAG: hypothetical protein AzoDbin1_00116 [Azoarcus sp.]|uniref:Uncharacterized protein n=1 Tax=Aromatoleum tolulyticum TaxID=34027 RepID=A0A1N6U2U9_9RHOO|nr:hypothetical protein [Azoarcus sp.]SIQ59942.1 hypothetical protein SAMN05421829_105200 [Aromatoleum tolulyticum]